MTLLRLHDPSRHPPDWNDHLRDGQVAVFFSDVETGEEVTPEGAARGESPAYCCVFNSFDQAKRFCIDAIDRHDHIRADVYDQRGRSADPLFSHVHLKHEKKYPTERSIRRRIRLSWLMMIPAPFLFWWDYRHDLGLILPTFLGINLIVIALRIRMWASGERELLRKRDVTH